MTDSSTRTGACLCGAVRFAAEGKPVNVMACHCRLCQRAMGSPFFARALYEGHQVTITGTTAQFPTSHELQRVFCPRCGTRLGAVRFSGEVALALALFDPPSDLAPSAHFFMESKAPWLELGDGLPQYAEWAPD